MSEGGEEGEEMGLLVAWSGVVYRGPPAPLRLYRGPQPEHKIVASGLALERHRVARKIRAADSRGCAGRSLTTVRRNVPAVGPALRGQVARLLGPQLSVCQPVSLSG